MSEFLFIRPGFGNDRWYSWFVYDEEGANVLASGRAESLEELAEQNHQSGDRSVVVLYPSAKAIFKKVTFPGRLRKNPNMCLCMLEDELSQEPEELEVRILHRSGSEYDVMVIEKGLISDLENELTTLGFKIERIIPDILAVPYSGSGVKSVHALNEALQKFMQLLNKKVGRKIEVESLTAEPQKKDDGANGADATTKNAAKSISNADTEAEYSSEATDTNDVEVDGVEEASTQTTASDVVHDVTQEQDEVSATKEDSTEQVSEATALQLGDEWLVRTGAYQGYVLGASWLNAIAESENAGQVTALTKLPIPHPSNWQEQLCPSVAETMAKAALAEEFSLSKVYARKKLEMQFLYPWYKVAASIVILAILLLVNYNYALKNLNAETQAYKQQQRIIFGKLTGSGPAVSNPVYSMKQMLNEKSPTGTYEGFVSLTKRLSAVLLGHSEMELVSMQYEQDRRQYVIRFLSDADWDIRKFTAELKADFSVALADSKPSRNQVLYTVHLRRMK